MERELLEEKMKKLADELAENKELYELIKKHISYALDLIKQMKELTGFEDLEARIEAYEERIIEIADLLDYRGSLNDKLEIILRRVAITEKIKSPKEVLEALEWLKQKVGQENEIYKVMREKIVEEGKVLEQRIIKWKQGVKEQIEKGISLEEIKENIKKLIVTSSWIQIQASIWDWAKDLWEGIKNFFWNLLKPLLDSLKSIAQDIEEGIEILEYQIE